MMHSVKISFLFQTDKCLFGSSENHTRHQLFFLHGALRFGEKINSLKIFCMKSTLLITTKVSETPYMK